MSKVSSCRSSVSFLSCPPRGLNRGPHGCTNHLSWTHPFNSVSTQCFYLQLERCWRDPLWAVWSCWPVTTIRWVPRLPLPHSLTSQFLSVYQISTDHVHHCVYPCPTGSHDEILSLILSMQPHKRGLLTLMAIWIINMCLFVCVCVLIQTGGLGVKQL